MSENNNQSLGDLFPDLGPEVPIISGVAHDNTESLATVRRVPNEPGMAAKVFTLLAEAGVNVDMIVQASASTGTADISFTVPGSAAAKVRDVLQEKQDELGYQSFDIDANVGKVAVVGVGMKNPLPAWRQVLQRAERRGRECADDLHVRNPHRRAGPARAAAGRRPRAAHCLRLGCRAGGSRGVWRYWSLTQYRAITIGKKT